MQARWLMTERTWPVAGASQGPQGQWHSLNLGTHVGDEPATVATNRARLARHLAGQGGDTVHYLQQVHGREVVRLGPSVAGLPLTADAAWTRDAGVVCTVMVADCLPVLFTALDAHGDALGVAAAHAGWRGLAGGVLEATVAALSEGCGAKPWRLQAWLGPCIGPTAFEVGGEVREAFASGPLAAPGRELAGAFKPQGEKFLADLAALARANLLALGLGPDQIGGNDSSASWCTVNNPSRFFSHRRDAAALGSSGRMAACIWLIR